MTNSISLNLRTATPLWTGGINTSCDRLHETGIMGSLRWWFELLIRGFEGIACDPSTNSCSDDNVCDACKIFGSTGNKRAFRIDWDIPFNEYASSNMTVIVSNTRRGWFIKRGILQNNLRAKFILPLRPLNKLNINPEDLLQMLLLTLSLACKYGGIGARSQHGYGVLEITEADHKLDLGKAILAFNKLTIGRVKNEDLPAMDGIFFAKIQFELQNGEDIESFMNRRTDFIKGKNELKYYSKQNIIPIAPVVRYYLRNSIRRLWPNNNEVRHRLMGTIESARRKSLINISHAYQVEGPVYEFRIWGWIPPESGGIEHQLIINQLRQEITASQSPLWNSCRINIKAVQWWDKNNYTMEEFLNSLLGDVNYD